MREFGEWLLGAVTTTGIVGAVAYLLRDTIANFFSNVIAHRFERRLEAFKGELRDNEKELEQIRSFLVSARRDHDIALQAKRLEAAEILLRARDGLAHFSILVEYMKVLNTEEILKDGENLKIAQFVEVLTKPFDVEEKMKHLGSFDKTLPRLYLGDQTLKAFEAYESIMLSAAMMMKIFSMPLRDKGNLVKVGGLRKTVIEQVPGSKEGFEKFGEGFAYHWATYFHDQILKLLRHEISGADELAKATKSAESLALDSRRAQINVRSTLEAVGLPDNLINTDEVAASSAMEKATR